MSAMATVLSPSIFCQLIRKYHGGCQKMEGEKMEQEDFSATPSLTEPERSPAKRFGC